MAAAKVAVVTAVASTCSQPSGNNERSVTCSMTRPEQRTMHATTQKPQLERTVLGRRNVLVGEPAAAISRLRSRYSSLALYLALSGGNAGLLQLPRVEDAFGLPQDDALVARPSTHCPPIEDMRDSQLASQHVCRRRQGRRRHIAMGRRRHHGTSTTSTAGAIVSSAALSTAAIAAFATTTASLTSSATRAASSAAVAASAAIAAAAIYSATPEIQTDLHRRHRHRHHLRPVRLRHHIPYRHRLRHHLISTTLYSTSTSEPAVKSINRSAMMSPPPRHCGY